MVNYQMPSMTQNTMFWFEASIYLWTFHYVNVNVLFCPMWFIHDVLFLSMLHLAIDLFSPLEELLDNIFSVR